MLKIYLKYTYHTVFSVSKGYVVIPVRFSKSINFRKPLNRLNIKYFLGPVIKAFQNYTSIILIGFLVAKVDQD